MLRKGFGKLDYLYDPLDYAWEVHEAYLRKFGPGPPGRILLVGLNPGPWGMGQTGVPFGDPAIVREWLGLAGQVRQPARLHSARPVLGFASRRREESGTTLYGWARDRFGTAERFFSEFWIVSYCHLLMFDTALRNVTPADFRKGTAQFGQLMEVCDRHLATVVPAIAPRALVGIGKFAATRAELVAKGSNPSFRIGCITHPSPQTRGRWGHGGWGALADTELLRYNS